MGTGPRGRANHSVYTLDGLMTPIARHNEIDNRMARIIYKDARPSWGRLVEVSVYDVTVERGDRYWLVHVPAIGRTTQVRSLREVEPMARDLITVMSSESLDPDDLQLNVHVELPDEVQARTCSATASCSRSRCRRRPTRRLSGDPRLVPWLDGG